MVEVTHLHCRASGVPEGDPVSTHHLAPRRKGTGVYEQVCAYCGETERELRQSSGLVELEVSAVTGTV